MPVQDVFVLMVLLHAQNSCRRRVHGDISGCTLQVFVQPLQLRRVEKVHGFDMSATNQWHWRPDYEVVELAQCRCAS